MGTAEAGRPLPGGVGTAEAGAPGGGTGARVGTAEDGRTDTPLTGAPMDLWGTAVEGRGEKTTDFMVGCYYAMLQPNFEMAGRRRNTDDHAWHIIDPSQFKMALLCVHRGI